MARKHLKVIRLSIVLLGLAAVAVAQEPAAPLVNKLMTPSEFRAAGLNKLTADELSALDQWLRRLLATMLAEVLIRQRTAATSGSSPVVPGTYPVEASVNDETFIINGNVFKAKTYCFGVNKGDRVKFVEGSASGVCLSAKFINMRTGDVCSVWCE